MFLHKLICSPNMRMIPRLHFKRGDVLKGLLEIYRRYVKLTDIEVERVFPTISSLIHATHNELMGVFDRAWIVIPSQCLFGEGMTEDIRPVQQQVSWHVGIIISSNEAEYTVDEP